MIPSEISKYRDLFTRHTELSFQENRNNTLILLNGNLTTNSKTTNNGISARNYNKGFWGFSSNSNISDEVVKKVIQEAAFNSSFLAGKKSIPGQFCQLWHHGCSAHRPP